MLTRFISRLLFFIPSYITEQYIFEVRSWLGRLKTGRLKINKSKANYINLGSGNIYNPDFINIDFFFQKKIDYGADLRYPLKIDDNCVDGIVCEHTMEHLTYEKDDQLLRECYRILKPDGVIRIILPDVSKFIMNYANNNEDWFKKWEEIMFINSPSKERSQRRIHSKMQALSFVTQEYGHVSAWDIETMTYYLQKNGFKNMKECSYKKGDNPELLIDTSVEGRLYVSLYIEAKK